MRTVDTGTLLSCAKSSIVSPSSAGPSMGLSYVKLTATTTLVFTNEVVIHIFALAVPLGVAPLGAWLLDRPGRARVSLVAGAFVAPTFAFHRGTWSGLWV